MLDKKFGILAARVSTMIGSVWAVIGVLAAVLISGTYFGFSEKWENHIGLIIAIAALFAVFSVQRSQSHDDRATHLKLDELVRAVEGARNEFASIENESEETVRQIKDDAVTNAQNSELLKEKVGDDNSGTREDTE